MNVEHIIIGNITPNSFNSRTHPEDQLRDLAASIREFGWTIPLLIDEDNVLLAGHGRLSAAVMMGAETVPCIRKLGLTPQQKRAYVIADNKLAQGSEWDEQILRMELRELMSSDYDVGILGFDDAELNLLLRDDPDGDEEGAVGWTEEDDAPPVPAPDRVVSRLGDVWVMGRHRLMCGDSLSLADMGTLAQGKVDLWLTDPPYNVAYEGGTKEKMTIKNDSMSDSAFREFLAGAYKAANSVMRPGAVFYIWHADLEGFNFRGACRDVGWPVRQCLIWRKNSMVLGRQDHQSQHEPCLYGWKPGAAHSWYGGRKLTTVRDLPAPSPFAVADDGRMQITVGGKTLLINADALVEEVVSSVINEAKPRRNGEHPTMKPVALFEAQVLNSSALGDVVADSFGGSGTTLIACQKTGRIARLMELDPKYCDVIVRRWQDYAAKGAVLESSGLSFEAVEAERVGAAVEA